MTPFDSNIEERFISKLIKDTINGQVKWTDQQNKSLALPSNERAISKLYTAEVTDRKFRVYEYQTKYYRDEDEWDWVERIRFELIDNNGDTLFDFEYDYSLYKLFNAIRQSNSGINDLMKQFLDE